MKRTLLRILTVLLLAAGLVAFCACENNSPSTDGDSDNVGAELIKYDLNEGRTGYILTEYKTQETAVVLPAEYNGLPVVEIGADAFDPHTEMSEITIPAGIKTIGAEAFRDAVYLDKVTYLGTVADWCAIDFKSDGANPLINATMLYIGGELLREAVLPDDATVIADYAFYGYGALERLTIGKGIGTIGYNAFYGCENLTEIKFNAVACTDLGSGWSDNSMVFGGAGADSGIAVTIGAEVTKIPAYLFCPNQSYLNDTPKIKSVSFADGSVCAEIGAYSFYNCVHLNDLYIPESVTSIGENAFYNAQNLQNLSYNAADCRGGEFKRAGIRTGLTVTVGAAVKYIPDGFFYNADIVKIDFAPASVCEYVGAQAFFCCQNLKEINIPATVTSFARTALGGCDGLKKVTCTAIAIPALKDLPLTEVVLTGGASIPAAAFKNCLSLIKITLPTTLTEIGSEAFLGCKKLIEVENHSDLDIKSGSNGLGYIAQNAEHVYSDGESRLVNSDGCIVYDGTVLMGYIGDAPEVNLPSVGSVHSYAFFDDAVISSVRFPASVTVLGTQCFGNNRNLTELTVDSGNQTITSEGNCIVTRDGTLLYGCGGSVIPDTVKIIEEGAFYSQKLTSVTIPEGVTEIKSNAFGDCRDLTKVRFDAIACSDVVRGSAFMEAGNGIILTLGAKVTRIPAYMFAQTYITSAAFIDGAVCTEIGACAFYDSDIVNFYVPDTLVNVGEDAFGYCTGLKYNLVNGGYYLGNNDNKCVILIKIQYKNSTTALIDGGCRIIYDGALSGCAVSEITLPVSIKYIGASAFEASNGLIDVYYDGTTEGFGAINKHPDWNARSSAFKITCSDGILDKFGAPVS